MTVKLNHWLLLLTVSTWSFPVVLLGLPRGWDSSTAAQKLRILSPRWDWIWKSTWAPSVGALGGALTLLSPGGGDQTAPRGSAWEGRFVYSRICKPLTLFSLDIQIRVPFTPS